MLLISHMLGQIISVKIQQTKNKNPKWTFQNHPCPLHIFIHQALANPPYEWPTQHAAQGKQVPLIKGNTIKYRKSTDTTHSYKPVSYSQTFFQVKEGKKKKIAGSTFYSLSMYDFVSVLMKILWI